MRSMHALALALAASIACAATVRAAGQLDPSFGAGGVVATDLVSSSSNRGLAVAIDPESRVLFTGTLAYESAFGVGRATAAGKSDTSFGDRGTARATFEGYPYASAYAIARQNDGAIVAAGLVTTQLGYSDVALARFDVSGALDPTFGDGGRVVLDVDPAGRDLALAVAILPDGKIVIGGQTFGSPFGSRVLLARFLPDGTPDPAFGTNGWAAYEISDYTGEQQISGLAPTSDGKIVFAVRSYEQGFIAGRALPDGSRDLTFGGTGVVTFDAFDHPDNHGRTVAVRPDGRVLVVGTLSSLAGTDVGVVQLTASGDRDPSFGSDGLVRVDRFESESGESCALLPDGKLVVAGGAGNGLTPSEQAIRLDEHGALDSNFGVGGSSTVPGTGTRAPALATAVGADGRIVTCGYDMAGHSGDDCLLVRRLPSGLLDPSFDGDGVALLDERASGSDTLGKIALAPGGKIVALGETRGSDARYSLVRYAADGSLDTTFAEGGRLVLPGTGRSVSVAVQPDGKILVLEWSLRLRTYVVSVRRFLPSGIADLRFGSVGVATAITSAGRQVTPYALAVAPDGRIVVAGAIDGASGLADGIVARLTSTGIPDRAFAAGGVFQIDAGGSEIFTDVFVLADGSIVAAGTKSDTNPLTDDPGFVQRLTRTGAPITSFGDGGHAEVRPSDAFAVFGWAAQADGKVVAAGQIYDETGGDADSFVYRLGTDGRPDAGFGSGGLTTFDAASADNDAAADVAVAPDGRLAVAGYYSLTHPYVARVTASGQLDATFGGGVVSVPLDGYPFGSFTNVAVQPDGRVVGAGTAEGYTTSFDFVLARVLGS